MVLPEPLAGRAGDLLSRLSLGSPSPCAQQLCLAAGLHLCSVQTVRRTLLTSSRGRIQCINVLYALPIHHLFTPNMIGLRAVYMGMRRMGLAAAQVCASPLCRTL